MSLLNIGDMAPGFTLADQNGRTVRLEELKGQWVILYFYPKALTPGCTVQACSLRDGMKELSGLNAAVFGVSPDQPAALKKFEEKENLNFTLLSDPDHHTADRYGAWQEKSMYGKKYMGFARMTYIVSPAGKIAHVMPKVSPKTHLDEVVKWLKTNAQKAA